MTTLLKQMKTFNTGERQPNYIRTRPQYTITTESEPTTYDPFDFTEKHIMQLKVFTAFYANPAQYERAKEYAQADLVDFLYKDAKDVLMGIRRSVLHGDQNKALAECDRLYEMMSYRP